MVFTKSFSGEDKNRIWSFLQSSFDDYKTSRLLFLNKHFVQACLFANTSIEKYLKAIHIFYELKYKWQHNPHILVTNLELAGHPLKQKLNEEFLIALENVYKGRYLSEAKPGYNYTIIQKKFMAELDFTYYVLHETMAMKLKPTQNPDHIDQYSPHTKLKIVKDYNYILNSIDKSAFCSGKDWIAEFRILPNYESLSITYLTNESKNDGKFIYEAIKMDVDLRSAKTTHLPDL